MALDLTALSATHARKEYNVQRGELRYGATEPRDAAACRCESAGLYLDRDDGEVRCWKCGGDQIKAKRRLFMTATPRFYTARVRREAGQLDVDIASMDDDEVLGPVLHSAQLR